tara:strand:- start:2190 stop:3578 length:1389 start_codon:yes stop_codon:yes gene_type:complete
MAFVDEIGYYAGSTSGKTSEISKFLANGVQYIISVIEKSNPDMLPLFASLQTLTHIAPQLALATNSKIIDVVRDSADSNGELLKCSPINAAFRSNAANTDSIYYADANAPVYYIDNAVLSIIPEPTQNQNAKISIVLPDTSVAHSDSTISNFPSEMYHGVVLYAAGQLIHNKMTALNAKLPTDLDADTTSFDAIDDIAQSISLIGLPSFANASKSLPNTIQIDSSLQADYGINATLPTLTISTSHNAEYLDALASAKNLIDIGITTDEASGVADDATVSSAGYWLKDEDEEMVQSTLTVAAQELQRASSYLAKFQADINKEVQEFTVDMQTYQAEIAEEQAKLNLAAQKVSTELSVDSTIASTDVAIYQAEMTREQTRYNSEITKYQADIQGKMESLNYELQEWNANLQKKVSLYTTLIGKLTTDYQWLQGQYQVVKSEFTEFMTPYTTGGILDSTVEGVRR